MIEIEDYVPVLHNPRHERFAHLVAGGQTPAEAYVAAGYISKTAYTCGPRLRKRTEVHARVLELNRTIDQKTTTRTAYDRQFVLRELMDNALRAKELQQFSASNKALELLGKELNMFLPVELFEATSLEQLPTNILAMIIDMLEKAADAPRESESGPTIDVQAQPGMKPSTTAR